MSLSLTVPVNWKTDMDNHTKGNARIRWRIAERVSTRTWTRRTELRFGVRGTDWESSCKTAWHVMSQDN